MIDRLISSLLAFFLALVPLVSQKPIDLPNNEVEIIFAGDTMLGRSVMVASLDNNDPYYPFRKTADFLSSADVTFVNLENAIIKNCPSQGKGSFTFCTSPEIAQGLKFSGIDIVTLANNHSGNYGAEGLVETKNYLSEMEIKWVDGTNCEVLDKNNTKFGFVGLDFVYKNLKTEDLKLITECKTRSDILIVSPHWGEEYQQTANRLQVTVAKQMIDNGADVIVGHHPHWVQNYEEYQGKPIYYSLGNFVFDQMWSEETKKGLVVKMTFDLPAQAGGKVIIKKEEFKTYTSKIGQPEIDIELIDR